MNAVGIDLASSPDYGATRYNRLGLAVLSPELRLLHLEAGRLDDTRILSTVRDANADIVAIDAPLWLPAGRCCADERCPCARFGRVRLADRALAALGYRPYWPLMRSMRALTLRGIALRTRLEALGLQVIEVFPGAVQDVLGLPRKQRGLLALREGLSLLGIRGLEGRDADGDELDAVTAAYMAYLFRKRRYRAVGDPGEAQVILPV